MNTQTSTNSYPNVPWYKMVKKGQWYSLVASNFGWLFDGYETYALILTVGVALKQLLEPSKLGALSFYAGLVIAITLLGWGIGGIIGGIIADYIGRRKAMIWFIIGYAVTTGISAIAWSWLSFAILRFIVGLCLGSEWGTGTAMVSEVFPDKARAKAAGIMQSGLGIGFFLASLVWYFVGGTGPNSWRVMFLIGILPAILSLWVFKNVDESKRWSEMNSTRQEIKSKKMQGEQLSSDMAEYEKFTLSEIFSDKKLRKVTLIGLVMSMTTTVGWWGISTWVPAYVSSIAGQHHLSATHWAGIAGMIYNTGAIFGYILLGFLADILGRKPTVLIYFGLSFLLTPVLFLWLHNFTAILIVTAVNAVFTLGQYTWMPVWLPECYPTRTRATGAAFVFNGARFVAFLGPLLAGTIISKLGGYGIAATTVGTIYVIGFVFALFFPETKGKPLPE